MKFIAQDNVRVSLLRDVEKELVIKYISLTLGLLIIISVVWPVAFCGNKPLLCSAATDGS
jgi:hypothetical protein